MLAIGQCSDDGVDIGEILWQNYVKNAAPCAMCKRMIINSGIESVVIRDNKNDFREISVYELIKNDESAYGKFGY